MSEYFEDWNGEEFNIGKYGGRISFPDGNSDIEFKYKDFHGFDILKHDMDYACDLLDVIIDNNLVEEKPYFAYKELNNVHEEIEKIVNSHYCMNAKDKDYILTEVCYLQLDVDILKDMAYHKLEFEV